MSKVDQLRALREARQGARKHGGNTATTAVSTATIAVSEQAKKVKTAMAAVSGFAFKARLRRLGWSLGDFSAVTQVPLRTVEEWSRKNSFPGWVDTLLFVLESSGDALTIINERLPADKEPHS